jgi:hypothetical protein
VVFRPLNSAGLVPVLHSLNTTLRPSRITCSNAVPHRLLHNSWFLHLCHPREPKMAASPHSHSGSLRLAHLVRWAAPKLFKPSQSPLSPSFGTTISNGKLYSFASSRRSKLLQSTFFPNFDTTRLALLAQADATPRWPVQRSSQGSTALLWPWPLLRRSAALVMLQRSCRNSPPGVITFGKRQRSLSSRQRTTRPIFRSSMALTLWPWKMQMPLSRTQSIEEWWRIKSRVKTHSIGSPKTRV